MKKILVAFTIISILLTAVGCGTNNDKGSDEILFYYCRQEIGFHTSDSVITAETRSAREIGTDADGIIREFLSGPKTAGLSMPFPNNVTLIQTNTTADTLHITLSKECADMTELDLTLSCACLAKTLFPCINADKIAITAENGFTNSDKELVFTRESVLTEDMTQTD